MICDFEMKDVSIESIKIGLDNWNLYEEDASHKIWVNNFSDVLSIGFFPEKPNLPQYVGDIHSLRNFYRDIITESNGAIVEVEKEILKNFLVVRTIFKIAQDPTGFTYLASFSMIMENYTIIIKVECSEKGTTGLRESIVLLIAEQQGLIPRDTLDGWFYDPYDPAFKGKISNNVSDQEKYDTVLPDHPLSRARKILAYIREKISISDSISPTDQYFKDL